MHTSPGIRVRDIRGIAISASIPAYTGLHPRDGKRIKKMKKKHLSSLRDVPIRGWVRSWSVSQARGPEYSSGHGISEREVFFLSRFGATTVGSSQAV